MAEQNEVFLTRMPQSPPSLIDEQEVEPQEEEVEVVEESPTQEANGDDLSNLFETPNRDDPDMRIDDVVAVTDEDVYGEGGEDMSDLTDVSAEDIMGEDFVDTPPVPQPEQPKRRIIRKVKRIEREPPPQPSIGGLRY